MSPNPNDQVVDILTKTRRTMGEAKAIIVAHVDQDADGLLKWSTAETEVVDLLACLERAPSLEPAPGQDPDRSPALSGHAELEFLLEAVDTAFSDLLAAAESAEDPADIIACLQASLRADRLLDSLR
ncbi:hypothetical protein ACIBF1_08630 [Spirillospora sp. NPDC050679]